MKEDMPRKGKINSTSYTRLEMNLFKERICWLGRKWTKEQHNNWDDYNLTGLYYHAEKVNTSLLPAHT